ncbi:MAG: hypothetical protein VX605_05945 [Pseudomonadota bacterium]|nr:hypothetical protein [Pseudomonadota bacterium]
MDRLIRRLIFSTLLVFNLSACLATQPRNITNVCAIFEDRRSWYRAAKDSEQRWGVPIAVNMAIIYQESSFRARARPERSKVLWVFPGTRPSSAYGYAQALDGTWQDYIRVSGNRSASRSEFDDAVDFVAWYNARSTRINNIASNDARSLYYAYHEGNGGYRQKSYIEKPWLVDAANLVQSNFTRFSSQLAGCRLELEKTWFQRLFS